MSFNSPHPKGVLSAEVVLSSTEIQSAADALPARFSDIFAQSGCVATFMGGDDLVTIPWGSKGKFMEVDVFRSSGNNDRIMLWWTGCYASIRTANAIIDHVDISEVSKSVKDDVKGQAYFYRGLSYSFLTRIFGKVPLIVDFNVAPDLTIRKAEVAAVYAQIIGDLRAAEDLLPTVRPEKATERGGYPGARPCKGTAKALLSQVYLTMAGWPLKQTSNYALAAAKAREVIDDAGKYGYELLSDPHSLWTWANNYTNKELIFGLYYNYGIGQINMHSPLGPRPEEYINPVFTWSTGWCDYLGELSFFKRFPKGVRKDATYQTVITVKGVDVQWNDQRTRSHHPYFKKYQESEPEASWAGSRTAQIIRYAEVLLNYAEARAMSSGADRSAYDAVNAIRRRAGLADLTPGLSAAAFRDSVVAERGWEFAGGEPASRWFDLIRLEKLEEYTALRDPSEPKLNHFPTNEDYWLPIPESEIKLNPNLGNN